MVFPAILLVVTIIIWPVFISFYNSLFDYKLNDPARSQTMLSSTIDLENYVDNYYYLEREMDRLVNENVESDHYETIITINEGVSAHHDQLLSKSDVQERYEMVEEIVMSFQPVRDSDLRYVKIDNRFAEDYKIFLQESSQQVELLTQQVEGEQLQNLSNYLETTSQSVMDSNFIGLAHYKRYFQESRMWASMWNTSLFTIVSVFCELVLGLMIALLINRSFKGRGLVRVSVLIPWAVPTAVAAMMWRYLYDGQAGIVAHYFEQIGIISDASVLLTTSSGAMFSIIFADVWKTTPYMALLLLAGLQTIPKPLYEAAGVDGANKFQQFYKITLPLLKPAILVALLFRTLDAFRVFDLIYVLTGGGPANATESISVYAYKTLFAQQNFGAGSALSVIVFLSVAFISFLFIKFIGSDLFDKRVKGGS
ncbi:carbohydrate ABC transporter permease [Halalkalibacter lacteus]|uniref:carbohydrate ABC transporter permease n=1 Tax=Halalkalibacter lacteus TaxID=3090663 RepID=UPI002FC769F5